MSGIDAWENVTVNGSTKALLQTRDADFRMGVPFAPVGNALEPGKWATYSCSDSRSKTRWGQTGSANCIHSALWLGVLVGDFRMSMSWIALPGFWNTSVSTYSKQIGRFGTEINALVSTVGARYDVPKPIATVTRLAPNFAFDYPVVRVGAWRSADAAYCATVVVVNSWQEVNVTCSLHISGVPVGTNMARVFAFSPEYNSSVSIHLSDSGEFTDLVTAGNAQIYKLGCDIRSTALTLDDQPDETFKFKEEKDRGNVVGPQSFGRVRSIDVKTDDAHALTSDVFVPVTSNQVRFMGRSIIGTRSGSTELRFDWAGTLFLSVSGATTVSVSIAEADTNRYRVFLLENDTQELRSLRNFTTNRTVPAGWQRIAAMDGRFCCDQAPCAGGHSKFLKEGPGSLEAWIDECETQYNKTCNFVTMFGSNYGDAVQYCNMSWGPAQGKPPLGPNPVFTYKRLVPGRRTDATIRQSLNYTLVTGLSPDPSEHYQLVLSKISEPNNRFMPFGQAAIQGFYLDRTAPHTSPMAAAPWALPKTATAGALPRRLEIVGDSITAGFGAGALNVTHPGCDGAKNEDGWVSWGAVLARRLRAEYSLIAWSAIGLVYDAEPVSRRSPWAQCLTGLWPLLLIRPTRPTTGLRVHRRPRAKRRNHKTRQMQSWSIWAPMTFGFNMSQLKRSGMQLGSTLPRLSHTFMAPLPQCWQSVDRGGY